LRLGGQEFLHVVVVVVVVVVVGVVVVVVVINLSLVTVVVINLSLVFFQCMEIFAGALKFGVVPYFYETRST
jgi:uncharacterized membrane protein